ncbi:hypothetical protein D3C72_2211480 [compost metagenome]
MRERDDDRLVTVVPRFEMVESRRFWTAPSELRRSSTFCRAESSVAIGVAEAPAVRLAAVSLLVSRLKAAVPGVAVVLAAAGSRAT